MLLSSAPPSLFSSRVSCTLICFVILGIFFRSVFFLRHSTPDTATVELQPSTAGGSGSEKRYFNRLVDQYGLTKETSWLAWRVQHSEKFSDWKSVADIHHNFQSQSPKIIDSGNPDQNDLRAKKKMELPVSFSPVPGTVHASELLLGVSTTYERLVYKDYAKIKAWARFLTNGRGQSNGASIIVMLDQATDAQVEKLDLILQKHGIDAYVTATDEPMSMARRYYELAHILKSFGTNLAANGQLKRWFGLIEDTIFFPNLFYLMDRLFSYNSESQMYIGIPSERSDWEMADDAITTYGGGAVFVTRSVISQISQLPCFKGDQTGRPMRGKNWDMLLQDCFRQHSGMKMHVLPGFYSPRGDTDLSKVDSYETGLQPLVLQRPEERHSLDVNKAHLVTNVCGESCFMQRYLFHDNWVLINGISITEYPQTLRYERRDLPSPHDMKGTTSLSVPQHILLDEDTTSSTILSWKGTKNVWNLLDANVAKDGSVWQAYIKRGVENAPLETDRIDSVIALIWEKQGQTA